MTAGIYGFGGLMGIVFYFAVDFLIGLMICMYLGMTPKPYFTSASQIVTSGLMGNIMTFMVDWVLFHNLVYVL